VSITALIRVRGLQAIAACAMAFAIVGAAASGREAAWAQADTSATATVDLPAPMGRAPSPFAGTTDTASPVAVRPGQAPTHGTAMSGKLHRPDLAFPTLGQLGGPFQAPGRASQPPGISIPRR